MEMPSHMYRNPKTLPDFRFSDFILTVPDDHRYSHEHVSDIALSLKSVFQPGNAELMRLFRSVYVDEMPLIKAAFLSLGRADQNLTSLWWSVQVEKERRWHEYGADRPCHRPLTLHDYLKNLLPTEIPW
ncbi:MAG: hypothetical protein ACEQSC_00075 [Candidatus Nanopelagicaceae bacterium]